jgi:hypothetical protein
MFAGETQDNKREELDACWVKPGVIFMDKSIVERGAC